MSAVLLLVVALPLLAVPLVLGTGPRRGGDGAAARYALRLGVAVTGAVLVLALVLAFAFDRDDPGMRFETNRAWASSLGLRFHLGVDGVSLPLIVLTALLTLLCAVHALGRPAEAVRNGGENGGAPAGRSARAWVALLLVLETGVMGTFAALDLVLFFIFFELVLVPMYVLVARWGTPGERGPAAFRFLLYTGLGSAVMLLGILVIQHATGTFDMVALADRGGAGISRGTQVVAFLALGIGLAVKVPMWPLHTWLPDAHTAAPTTGSVLLAGVLLKMGTYGLVRVALPVLPYGAETFAPYLAAFGVVGILYGSLICLALVRRPDGDLKRIIAYSSVGHMGFALLGIATLTPQGVNGALFVNIGHGLVTGLLFFLAGAVKDRHGTATLSDVGRGLYGRAPRLGGLLAFGAVASLGLPGLAGFWGEMLALFGAFKPAADLSRPAFLTFMAVGAFGTLLTAAYMLVVVRRVCMGAVPQQAPKLADVHSFEFAAWTPLVALTVLAGLWPKALLGLTDPAVQQLLAGGTR
jgi:NADH-quinone oxidoreductase subunit M